MSCEDGDTVRNERGQVGYLEYVGLSVWLVLEPSYHPAYTGNKILDSGNYEYIKARWTKAKA